MEHPSTKTPPPALDVPRAVRCALRTIEANLVTFADCYPDDTTAGNIYGPRRPRGGFARGGNFGWTTGFWPGMLWLAYELTGEEAYGRAAERRVTSFIERIRHRIDVDTHDLGFLYTLACVAPWRLTGHTEARLAALEAAECLMTRYLPAAGIIQAWGNLDDPAQRGRTIVDSLMNMPLLYWASEETGEPAFADAAHRHAARVRDHMVRPNATTYHTFYWDAETGAPLRGNTAQGYSDNSCWARRQAWTIYGFALNYRDTADETLLAAAEGCARYFLDHLPEDRVAYWDLVLTAGRAPLPAGRGQPHAEGEERDSSAAAIAVCGLQELARLLPAAARRRYRGEAEAILASLAARYAPCDPAESNALLLHGVYDKPKAVGVDEGNLWGDYFYLEALTRAAKADWRTYW